MPTCAERAKWAGENVTSKEGRKFSLKGREWVVRNFWRPADGFKVWPKNVDALCDKCRADVGTIEEAFDWKKIDKWNKHAAGTKGACEGLTLAPIIVTVLNLPRREGKTFNVAVFILALIFLTMRRFVLFIAAAGDQTERLFEDNFEAIINQSEEMLDACEIVSNKIYVESTGSRFEYAKTTSHRTITGGGFTHVVLEEARDLHPRTVAAAVMSIRDQNGYECPINAAEHTRIAGIGELRKHKCQQCGAWLVPWYPRIIIPSSSGIEEGSDRDWFHQLAELLEQSCPANYYLYRSTQSTNPAVSSTVTDALTDGLGRIEALKTYMDVELSNTSRRLGEDFLTGSDIDAITNKNLLSLEGSELDCVGFLDTSWSSDKTSLMFGGWDPESCAFPWQQLRMLHWKWWEPKKLPRRVMDKDMVLAYLDQVMPNFPNLKVLLVDDRGSVWAKELVIECNQTRRGWGQKVKLFHGKRQKNPDGKTEKAGSRLPGIYGGQEDRTRAWQFLEQRAMLGRSAIEIPHIPELKKEILGVQKVEMPDGTVIIKDRDRRKQHADLADCLAQLCLLAFLWGTKQPGSKLDSSYSAKHNQALARIPVSKMFGGGGGFGI